MHWLGTVFDPALGGYWGSEDVATATATFVDLLRTHADRVDGVKVSLLDAGHEVALRRTLAGIPTRDGRPVRLYTGDDFNFPELVAGDEQGHSDALLGVFAATYPAAAAALAAFDDGDPVRGRAAARRHPGARPAPVRGADVPLQDRHRVPVLAQRPPAGVPDGRRPPVGALGPGPGPHAASRGRGRAAGRPGARGPPHELLLRVAGVLA